MPDVKMPWDTVPESSSNIVKGVMQQSQATNGSNEILVAFADSKKYGFGKPYRIFIRGDIKSDPDK